MDGRLLTGDLSSVSQEISVGALCYTLLDHLNNVYVSSSLMLSSTSLPVEPAPAIRTCIWWYFLLFLCVGCTEHWGSPSRGDWLLQREWFPWLGGVWLWLCTVQHPILLQCPCPETEPQWEESHHKPVSDARSCQAIGPEPKSFSYFCCSVR